MENMMNKNSKNNNLSSIPNTESIKYIGSKLKMLPYILRTISSLNDINTVLDRVINSCSSTRSSVGWKNTN